MLHTIRVVLVNTYHPGNIGSAARAMKTMGLSHLYLVQPREFPAAEADTMAVSAVDVLHNAVVVDSLFEAVADCALVVACSARQRGYDIPQMEPEEASLELLDQATQGPVALVFGPERMGLSNDDLRRANIHVSIPANPEYSSLNLAAAVQTLCYELYKTHLKREHGQLPKPEKVAEYPTAEDMERFYVHLEETLNDTGFIIKQHPGEIMLRLRRLFDRARPEKMEMNILRGILASVQRAIGERASDKEG